MTMVTMVVTVVVVVIMTMMIIPTSGVPRNFVRGGSTNSVQDRGQREWGSGGGSP